jgi:hypothetical protein
VREGFWWLSEQMKAAREGERGARGRTEWIMQYQCSNVKGISVYERMTELAHAMTEFGVGFWLETVIPR